MVNNIYIYVYVCVLCVSVCMSVCMCVCVCFIPRTTSLSQGLFSISGITQVRSGVSGP